MNKQLQFRSRRTPGANPSGGGRSGPALLRSGGFQALENGPHSGERTFRRRPWTASTRASTPSFRNVGRPPDGLSRSSAPLDDLPNERKWLLTLANVWRAPDGTVFEPHLRDSFVSGDLTWSVGLLSIGCRGHIARLGQALRGSRRPACLPVGDRGYLEE
jgi:hypothetical protein